MTRRPERIHLGESSVFRNALFFSDLTQDETDHVEQLMIKKHFSKDQIVLFEEDTSNYMYFVYSGKVRVVKIYEDGREQIITFHKKGDFFGEMSLLDGKTSPATVIAHEAALIGLLSRTDFERNIMCNDNIRRKIINLLCLRLRDSWKMIKLLSYDSAEKRIKVVLGQLQELYGVRDSRGIIVNIQVRHQLIANYASVTRETATRILNKFEKSGEIEFLENKSLLLKEPFCRTLQEMLV